MSGIERSSRYASWRTERSTRESGSLDPEGKARRTDAECRYGLTAPGMTGFGAMVWPMAMDASFTLRVTSMKESGPKIRRMVTVFTPISTEAGTKANGTQISSTVLELSNGLMAPNMMVSMSKE